MYDVMGKPGKQCVCGWCQMSYGPHRKYGGFMAFVDPMNQPGAQTLYGVECCERCYQQLYRFGMKQRLELATGLGRTLAPTEPNLLLNEARWEGEYPVSGPEHKGAVVWCKQSLKLQSLSPVNGVHLCLTMWAENKGAKYYPQNWWKQKGIGKRREPLPELPNKRGRRKPSLRGTRQLSLV